MQRQPVIGGDAQKYDGHQRRDRDDGQPDEDRPACPVLDWIASAAVAHHAFDHGGLGLIMPEHRLRGQRRQVAPNRKPRPATIASVV